MTAVNLARLGRKPLEVTLVNGRPLVGRGIAYGTRRPEHLLNVAARNMSAFRDEPDHFLQWLRTRSEFETVPEIELRERFIPRLIYGDYLRSVVQHHLQSAGGMTPVETRCVVGEAVDIEVVAHEAVIHLADGKTVAADRVVLATGNEVPAALPGTDALADHPAWAADPWQPWERRLPEPDGTVIILGTGLSAVDVIITLRALGWMGSIYAVLPPRVVPPRSLSWDRLSGVPTPRRRPRHPGLGALDRPRAAALYRPARAQRQPGDHRG